MLYYNCVEDRLRKLLSSDLKNLFDYSNYRPKPSEGVISDIFDTSLFKLFYEKCPNDGKLIYLQVCWDGADMFNFSGKSMWPICYCIMNLPPSLRDKMHVGMHVASFDNGSDAGLEVFTNEMFFLWENGLYVDGCKYYVCCPQIVMDGRGREKFCNVQVSFYSILHTIKQI